MKHTALFVAAALLLTACVAAASYFVCINHSYEIDYADLHFEDHQMEGNTFSFKVGSDLDGEYIYKVLTSQNGEPGELVLTFRGGKQPSLAQTPDQKDATFEIEVPAGITRIVCDDVTVYTIDE